MPAGPKYHIETRNRNGKQYHYLVKNLYVSGKSTRVANYIKSGELPTEEELRTHILNEGLNLEEKARKKVVQVRLEQLTIEYLTIETAAEIESIRYFDKYLSSIIPSDDAAAYEQQFEQQYVHGTTAIEGNTLTYNETVELLEHGIIPASKNLREINEVQNYKNVAKYRNAYHGRVTLEFIKKLHELIMANILEEPGVFRMTDGVVISGYDQQLTPALLIEDELQALIDTCYEDIMSGKHPFECAVMFHYRFELIHPFVDGNGRVGRELLNYLLVSSGYPRVLILGEKRNEYLSALKSGNMDEYAVMMEMFARLFVGQQKPVIEANMKNIPVLMARWMTRTD